MRRNQSEIEPIEVPIWMPERGGGFKVVVMSHLSLRFFRNDDFHGGEFSAAYEVNFDWLADVLAIECGLQASCAFEIVTANAHQDVANDDASICSRAVRFDEDDEESAVRGQVEGVGRSFGEGDGLNADPEVATGDTAFAEELVEDAVDGGCGNGDG